MQSESGDEGAIERLRLVEDIGMEILIHQRPEFSCGLVTNFTPR